MPRQPRGLSGLGQCHWLIAISLHWLGSNQAQFIGKRVASDFGKGGVSHWFPFHLILITTGLP